MCGICGMALNNTIKPDKKVLDVMNRTLVHRGPDQEGTYTSHGVGLGIRRLAIVDLKTGDQPISSENDHCVVVCNGEIYNAPELRQTLTARGHSFKTTSDVEVIIHLWEQYGKDCINHLRGMFAFALWDTRQKSLLLARDRFGIKPLYYSILPDGLYFASEQKALLTIPSLSRNMDFLSLSELFTLGFVASPKTLFAEIRQLEHSHYLLFNQGVVQSGPYWSLNLMPEKNSAPIDQLPHMIDEKLAESVNIHTRSDVPVAAWLSAGVDSSAVVAYMLQHVPHPIDVYSLSYEEKSVDEFYKQRTLADFPDYAIRLNKVVCHDRDFNLFPQSVWHCEDPFTSAAEISRLILSRGTASKYKVVLTGEGADEVFAGYPWYRGEKLLRYFQFLPPPIRHLIADLPVVKNRFAGAAQVLKGPPKMGLERFSRLIGPPASRKWLPALLSAQLLDKSRLWDTKEAKQIPDYHSSLLSLQHLDINVRLCDAIVRHLDRMTMACSLEARVPFLDHELVELCCRIPISQRYRIGQEKMMLRKSLKGKIPEEIRLRRKYSMTTPFQKWLRNDLPDFARLMFSKTMIEKKGYFNFETVESMLKMHRQGGGDYARLLMAVLGIQVWDELFVQGKTAE
ncbi:asparagine synthase (glutamine-hydrolyzing) [candidate division KSB1 bacterium]|nr:asparagine synthase (glutamine-hydrolyzing) [candidate division KSB1 bacterium]